MIIITISIVIVPIAIIIFSSSLETIIKYNYKRRKWKKFIKNIKGYKDYQIIDYISNHDINFLMSQIDKKYGSLNVFLDKIVKNDKMS